MSSLRVILRSRAGYEVHVSPHLVNIPFLRKLFLIDEPLLLDSEILDVVPASSDSSQSFHSLVLGRLYMVVTQEDIDAVLDDRDPDPVIQSQEQAVLFSQRLLEARKQFVRENYVHCHPHLLKFSMACPACSCPVFSLTLR